MKEALFYRKLKNNLVQCQLCPHFCVIKEGLTGKCRVRRNINGELCSLSYGKPVSINMDQITKKPLYHYLPGTLTYSIGMAGCNLRCMQCQNWNISQRGPEEIPVPYVSSKEVVERALKSGCPSISYTYSEPLVSFEYVYDIAKLAKKKGLKNILVTNGFVNQEPLRKIMPLIDAANIDLKSFSEKTYLKLCGAKLAPVLETIKRAYEAGIHIEITTLVIPGVNDDEKQLKGIANFIFRLDKTGNVPWHISRFFPMYKMADRKKHHITPYETLKKAYDIGEKAGLNYIHLGNV